MSERTDQLSRSRESDVEDLLDDPTDQQGSGSTEESSDTSRLAGYFAPKVFLVVFAVLAVLGQVGSTFVPLVGGPLGVFLGAFAVGLVGRERPYGESLLAGGLVGVLAVLVDSLTIAVATGSMVTLTGIGAGAGALLAVLGVYFGRDLRNGLTEEI